MSALETALEGLKASIASTLSDLTHKVDEINEVVNHVDQRLVNVESQVHKEVMVEQEEKIGVENVEVVESFEEEDSGDKMPDDKHEEEGLVLHASIEGFEEESEDLENVTDDGNNLWSNLK